MIEIDGDGVAREYVWVGGQWVLKEGSPWNEDHKAIPHNHREYVEGCFRCELSRDEVGPSGGGEVSQHPKMYERVLLEGVVNGYSESQEGTNIHPIVSVFIPDGSQTWGMHGPSGTTVWMSLEKFNSLPRPSEEAK